VERVLVRRRVHGDGLDAELVQGPDHTDGDLSPVRDEDAVEHRWSLARQRCGERAGAAPQHGLAVRDEHARHGQLQEAARATRAGRRASPSRATAPGTAAAPHPCRAASRRRRGGRRRRRPRAAAGASRRPRPAAPSRTPGSHPAARSPGVNGWLTSTPRLASIRTARRCAQTCRAFVERACQ
jgi:hypothetical protein